MLTALQNNKIIIARDAQKPGDFHCPECFEPLTLRKGSIKTHHFAHRSSSNCGYGKGESERHMDLKMQVFDSLLGHPNVEHVELEKSLGRVRADVFANISGTQVAIEIQISKVSIEDLVRRTQAYAEQDIALIWIQHLPKGSSLFKFERPTTWESWIHTCNLGQIYLWLGNGCITPIKLANHEHGVQISHKYHIAEDFHKVTKGSWDKGKFYIPNRVLWCRIRGSGFV
ncbi:putative competence protein [Xenorhabdus mauleonii]|uniref:Competence protein n=1 Tax=Xenorhabdus mauleonii TaxID=351675 RepID=A0A1I3WNP9_9GAMM|nr:putative competence protein [Xenorhabdus mauleonii]SFK08793.1 competence protein CoiA [Xenorhabdus mauleonii]